MPNIQCSQRDAAFGSAPHVGLRLRPAFHAQRSHSLHGRPAYRVLRTPCTVPSALSGPSGGPPSLTQAPSIRSDPQPEGSTSGRRGPAPGPPPPPSSPSPSALFRRVLRSLANLKLAIAELATIAALSSIGTVIEQNKPVEFYMQNYPAEGPKVLGFVTYQLIATLQLDHIYTANYFLMLMALLAGSLAACTTTTQWPMVRVAKRWRFQRQPTSFERMEVSRLVPSARLQDLGAALAAQKYQVFMKDGALYAFKGLAGKLGPIGVHASMLAVMAGIAVGGLGGFSGTAMIPEGNGTPVAQILRPFSPLGRLPDGARAALRVDNFRIDYRSDGSVRQFFTDVAVTDLDGRQLAAKTISVNQPLRYGGVTAYQTDWSLAAVTVRAAGTPLTPEGGGAVNLPMASLEGRPGIAGKLYAAFLPIGGEDPTRSGRPPPGISMLARDLQTVTLYDSSGKFAGVRRPGSGKPITVDGIEIVVEGVVAASGMELKSDPGVPLVYAGFGGMCITTVVSYLSHSQVWAAQTEGNVLVGGRSNRAKFGFERELEAAIEAVPEV